MKVCCRQDVGFLECSIAKSAAGTPAKKAGRGRGKPPKGFGATETPQRRTRSSAGVGTPSTAAKKKGKK